MLQSGPCTSSEEDEKKEKEDMSTFLRVDLFYFSTFCDILHCENSNFAIISLKRGELPLYFNDILACDGKLLFKYILNIHQDCIFVTNVPHNIYLVVKIRN